MERDEVSNGDRVTSRLEFELLDFTLESIGGLACGEFPDSLWEYAPMVTQRPTRDNGRET